MADIPADTLTLKTVAAIRQRYQKAVSGLPVKIAPGTAAHHCDRFIWLAHRQCATLNFDASDARVIAADADERKRIIEDLRAIGCEVHTTDPTTGGPITYSAVSGHLTGAADAIALGLPDAPKTWHLVAIHADADDFADLGASPLRDCRPKQEAAIQIAMHLLSLDRTLYLCVDPASQDIYGERIEADPARAMKLIARVAKTVAANLPPARYADPAPCTGCAFTALCWGSRPPAPALPAPVTCRNCVHSTPRTDADGGRWTCEKHRHDLSATEQDAACEDHLIIPDLVEAWAKVTDAGYAIDGDWTEYETTSGARFINSKREHAYSTRELATLLLPMIGAGTVHAIKQTWPHAEAVNTEPEDGSIDDYRRQAAETF